MSATSLKNNCFFYVTSLFHSSQVARTPIQGLCCADALQLFHIIPECYFPMTVTNFHFTPSKSLNIFRCVAIIPDPFPTFFPWLSALHRHALLASSLRCLSFLYSFFIHAHNTSIYKHPVQKKQKKITQTPHTHRSTREREKDNICASQSHRIHSSLLTHTHHTHRTSEWAKDTKCRTDRRSLHRHMLFLLNSTAQ